MAERHWDRAKGNLAMDQDRTMKLIFRCPPELAEILPPPVPAVQGLPDWFKALPHTAFNALTQAESQTVKRCPPFIDAMTYGFLIPLPCDLKVENGAFSWDFNVPVNSANNFMRSPIAFHDASQVAGTPYQQGDNFAIKFNNFWTIEAPPGYSLLFTHPVNRADLPFTTLTGLVDFRPLPRQPRAFSGALARSEFQRHPAEGDADRAMHAGQARNLGGVHRNVVER